MKESRLKNLSQLGKKEAACVAGFGTLLAALCLSVQRAAPFSLIFGIANHWALLFGAALGLTLSGLVGVLFFHTYLYSRVYLFKGRPYHSGLALLQTLGAMLWVTAMIVEAATPEARVTMGSLSFDPWGILLGIAIVFVFDGWAMVFTLQRSDSAIKLLAFATLFAGLFFCLESLVQETTVILVFLVLDLTTAVVLLPFVLSSVTQNQSLQGNDQVAKSNPNEIDEHVQDSPSSTLRHRLWVTFRFCWQPVIAALIGLFLFSYTWNPTAVGIRFNSMQLMLFEESAGIIIAASCILLLLRIKRDQNILLEFTRFWMPIIVCVFLFTPYLPDFALGTLLQELIATAREAGLALFALGAWMTLTRAAQISDTSVHFLMSAFALLCGLAAFAGFTLCSLFGITVKPLGAILFVIYLAALIILMTIGNRDERNAKIVEHNVIEAYLKERCDNISKSHNLTVRETEILYYMGRGHNYVFIAETVFVSENTIRTHVRNIFRKLNISSREDLLAMIDRN
jgi:DNA-binding CsgD family transcriptional regulator